MLKLPFVTGSRAYGMPKEDSDLDLVVLVEEDEYEIKNRSLDSNSDVAYSGNIKVALTIYFFKKEKL